MQSSLNWSLKTVKLSSLIEFDRNPREMTAKQRKELQKCIEKFGLIDKPIINQNSILIAGHQRVKLLIERGDKDCEVWYPSRLLTDDEVEELNIRHNANTGQWSIEILEQKWDLSIIEDGWTQPIVSTLDNEIVDGFHRWTVSGWKEVYQLTGGYVPTVRTRPMDKASQMISTIRHNRASGTHAVLPMAEIVEKLAKAGLTKEEIMKRLGMEGEEVTRLLLRVGVSETDLVNKTNWSQTWEPS